MGDMLSQAEIDALLNGSGFSSDESSAAPAASPSSGSAEGLSAQESDALGEIGNICMGTSATTLFTLLGQKVNITTPEVFVLTWEELAQMYSTPYVAVKVEYTMGLLGSNLLIMKESDVKVITDLMMGGDGTNVSGELTDLHLSAISEAMNQMVGSSSTSMSSMLNERIDISPPKAFMIRFDDSTAFSDFAPGEKIVKISFRMVIGDLIDSEIMQLLPISFARTMVSNLMSGASAPAPELGKATPAAPAATQQAAPQPMMQQPMMQQPMMQQPMMQQPMMQQQMPYGYPDPAYGMQMPPMGYGMPQQMAPQRQQPVNVAPAQFQAFDESTIMLERKNIGLIMDVPLQVTVELGRTQKLIKDILEFSPGSIIELDKLAGEPVDILVNGKIIAKGEVVVIDESFGVKITDIIDPSKRLG